MELLSGPRRGHHSILFVFAIGVMINGEERLHFSTRDIKHFAHESFLISMGQLVGIIQSGEQSVTDDRPPPRQTQTLLKS